MRLLIFIAMAAMSSAVSAEESMPRGVAQVQCSAERVVVKSNLSSLENVLTRLSGCLGFDLRGTDKLDKVIMRAPEVSGTPIEVLRTVLEGINVLIVGDEKQVERMTILSAGQRSRESASGDRGIEAAGIESLSDTVDDSTAPVEPTSSLTDTMERRALAASNTNDIEAAAGRDDTHGVSGFADPQEYLPELTRQSQEQLKALVDALERAGTP